MDEYVLQFWPAPFGADEVVRQGSEWAANWRREFGRPDTALPPSFDDLLPAADPEVALRVLRWALNERLTEAPLIDHDLAARAIDRGEQIQRALQAGVSVPRSEVDELVPRQVDQCNGWYSRPMSEDEVNTSMTWRCLSTYISPHIEGTSHVFDALWRQTRRPLVEHIYQGSIQRLLAAQTQS